MKDTPTRGVTLIEAMMAMVVMLVGAVGMIGLHKQGQRMNGDALRITRATAIAQDLVGQMNLWPFTDPRLANPNPGNDTAIGDPAFAFEGTSPPFDFDETGLTAGGTTWLGIPGADLQASGYQRFWSTSTVGLDSNANGVADAVRIAVVVRWPSGGGFRRIVLLATKNNPAESR